MSDELGAARGLRDRARGDGRRVAARGRGGDPPVMPEIQPQIDGGTARAFVDVFTDAYARQLQNYELDDDFVRYRLMFRRGVEQPNVAVVVPPGWACRVGMPVHDPPMELPRVRVFWRGELLPPLVPPGTVP